MKTPDLLGLRLRDGLYFLEKNDIELTPVVVKYCPPDSKNYDKDSGLEERIIRQRMLDDKRIELVVSSFCCCLQDI
jgi:hypothetical protein